jgi:hypothetical protein
MINRVGEYFNGHIGLSGGKSFIAFEKIFFSDTPLKGG